MKRFLLLIVLLSILLAPSGAQTSLYENFKNPPADARPWTFWYWMYGAVSKEGIRADLEAMKQAGLGGTYLMPIKGVEGSDYPNAAAQLSPRWWELVRYSMQVADSLGLKLGMHICDGFALAGGPWIKPEESMQKIVSSDTIIKGGALVNLKLRQPETNQNYYQDIAVFALPLKGSLKGLVDFNARTDVAVSSDNPENSKPFSEAGKDFRSEKPTYIQYSFAKPFTLRSIEVIPAGNNFQSQRFTVLASKDGVKFHVVRQLVPPRQGWQNYVANTTFAIEPTKARFFRLAWTPEGTEPASEELDAAKWKPTLKIKAIRLSTYPRINSWEGKNGMVWRVADESTNDDILHKECSSLKKIIPLTPSLANGVLNCKLPRGEWRIVRIGHTSTGLTNATGGGAKGLECDKFSEAAVQKQFDNWFGAAFAKTDTALAKRVLKYMHIDSWECSSQNWSDGFAAQFRERRGYDLMPYLPLMAGFPVESAEKSEQVLRDVRLTIAELVNDVFFNVMVQNAKKYGCQVSAESVAPTMVSDGMLHYKSVDLPMGEFWLNSPTHDKPNDMLDAISGAHVYGKNIVQSESFTQLRTTWDETPAMLKPLADRNYAMGINRIFYHIFVHNPYLNRAPGMTLDGIGLYFQRDQTWWKQGRAFVDYMARCQSLLQYGKPVADLAVFTGEEIPRRALTPDKLVPYLPSLMGEARVQSEKLRQENAGQPMREMPAGVNSAANAFLADKWINPLNGYAYDSFNKDVLLHESTIADGALSLSDGAGYRVVLFPEHTNNLKTVIPFSSEVKEKIKQLEKAGVKVIHEKVFHEKDFSSLGVIPDVLVPENVAWTHRTGEMGDVYFISNQEGKARSFTAVFRNAKTRPTEWNPVTAEISEPKIISKAEQTTSVAVNLPPYGSTFIVFSYKNYSEGKTDLLFEDSIPVAGKWKVDFVRNRQTVASDTLFDWSKSANPLIKYYSGAAVYKTTFGMKTDFAKQVDAHTSPVWLSLGKVCNLATVRLNGIDCGVAWTEPYRVDISKALKKGSNTLEIEVVNTWANALNGADKGAPPFTGIWTNGKYRMKEDRLLEAGLFGPIRIVQK